MSIASNNTDGTRIMAISDVNNDKFNDIITVNTQGTVVTVYYYNEVAQNYGSSS